MGFELRAIESTQSRGFEPQIYKGCAVKAGYWRCLDGAFSEKRAGWRSYIM